MSISNPPQTQLAGMTKCFAYAFLRHIYLPPEEGGVEATKNEWIKFEVTVKKFSDRTVVVYPHSRVPFAATAVVLDDGTVITWQNLPKSYKEKKVGANVIEQLDKLSWDIRKMRCEDCPEFPWEVLFRTEMINMRVEDHYGSFKKMERFYATSDSNEMNKDLFAIRDLVLDVPTQLT